MKKIFIAIALLLSVGGAAFSAEESSYSTFNLVYGQMNQSAVAVPDGVLDYGLGVDEKFFLTDFMGFSCGVNFNLMNLFDLQTNNLFFVDIYIGIPFKPIDTGSLVFVVTPTFGFNLFSNDLIGFLFSDVSMDVASFSLWAGAEVSLMFMLSDDFGISIADQIEYRFAGFGEYRPFDTMNHWANQLKLGLVIKN